MTGRNQTINDILSNKKLRDQNAYVEVFSQTAPETLPAIRYMGGWGGGLAGLLPRHWLGYWPPGSEAQEQVESRKGSVWGPWEPKPWFLPTPMVPLFLLP